MSTRGGGAASGASATGGRVELGLGSLGDLVALWLTMAIAAVALWPIYRSEAFIVLAAVSILVGTAIAVAGALLRWHAWLVMVVTVVVFSAIGVPLAVPSRAVGGILPSPAGLAELFGTVALGWKQLLTITLPVGDYQALLVPAFVLLLVGTVIAGSIALRTRHGENAAIVPTLIVLVAIIFGPDQVDHPIATGLAMLLSGVLWGSWRRWRRRRAVLRRSSDASGVPRGVRLGVEIRGTVAALVLILVASAAAVSAVAAVPPSAERDVLRNVVAQPFDPRDHTSPLSGFRRYLHPDQADEPMLRIEGLPAGSRVRVATLDSYDGVVYAVGSATVDSASGVFVRVPSAVQREGAGERVTLEVTVEGYEEVWLPTVGDLVRVVFRGGDAAELEDGLVVNLTTGTAADTRGLTRGDRYRLDTVLSGMVGYESLASASPGFAETPRIAEPPDELVTALDEWTAGIEGQGARLVAAIDNLRATGYISHGIDPEEHASRSGHSLNRLTELFAAPLMVGDAEQYAVAAALIANRLGFPARVVVGFAPEAAGAAEVTTVRGSDVTAWIEVDTAERGWVAVDPVPPPRPIPEEEPQEPTLTSRPESIVPPPADRADPRDDQTDADTSSDEPTTPDLALETFLQVLRAVGIGALVIIILLGPFLLVVAAKARRRHLRRTAPTPLARIRGGWDEFADLVIDHRLPVAETATRSELAAAVGTLPSRVLAAVVDRAVFAPGDPPAADADRVWTAVGELRQSLDAGRSRRERLRARVSVRSLDGGVREFLRRPGGGS